MGHHMAADDFAQTVRERFVSAGLGEAELVENQEESSGFGDALAVFRLGPLILRVVRDRGEEFVDLGSIADRTSLFQFDDVEIALGWKSIDEVLQKQEPEALGPVLERISRRLEALQAAFSGDRARFTSAQVQRAARDRGDAFAARLRGD